MKETKTLNPVSRFLAFIFACCQLIAMTSCEKNTEVAPDQLMNSANESRTSVLNNVNAQNTDKPPFHEGGVSVKSVIYIEAGNDNMLNAGRYVMEKSGKPFFDMALLFAANMGWVDGKFNVNLGSTGGQLNNVDKYVRPLQAKGMKVLISYLGAMQNYTLPEIEIISLQIKEMVDRYGLDGVNFDDEYQSYDGVEMPIANNYSYTMLVKRCKERMPDKIVSYYNIGGRLNVVDGVIPGNYLDYAWQAYYGSYGAPNIPGLTDKTKLGPGAAWIPIPGDNRTTSVNTATNIAQRTVNDGYGVMVFYDLRAGAITSWLESVGNALYNDKVLVVEEPYLKDWQ